MLYLSHILKSRVTDSSDKTIGRLKDILIKPQHGFYSPLLFLLIKGKNKRELFIPYEYVENLSREEITLKALLANIPEVVPPEDLVYLDRDVMDQQIVDVEGARVVRVNDLRLGLFEEKMCVLGIDISFKGIIRRLWGPKLDFLDVFKVNLLDWRQAQPIKGVLKLSTIAKDLNRLHPADLANIVENLNLKRGSKLVNSLDPRAAAKVVEELDPEIQKIIIGYLGPERATGIMEQMSADEVVDLLKMMPKEEAKTFLSRLQINKLKKVEKLIKYPDNTAGGLMTTEFVLARPDWTVAQTIEEVKKQSPALRTVMYAYVVGEDNEFLGAVSMRRLLLASPETIIKNIIKKLSRRSILKINQKIDDIVKIMTKYNLYSAAVLDKHHKLMGIVTIDDVMRRLVPNA